MIKVKPVPAGPNGGPIQEPKSGVWAARTAPLEPPDRLEIDLDDGPRMMANIVGDGALEVAMEEAVEVTFEERGEGFMLPQFKRLDS